MNRKFVKENKTLVKEFIGALISKIVAGGIDRSIERKMKKDPEFRKAVTKLRVDYKELDKRLKKAKRDNPDFYNDIKDLVA